MSAKEDLQNMSFIRRYGRRPGIIYESPDGEKCLEKTVELAIFGAKVGTMFSVIDLLLISKPSTVLGVASRYALVAGPGALGGAAFGATSGLLGSMRGKDDVVNHAAGAMAGAFCFAVRGGAKYALGLGVIASVIAAVSKQLHIEGIPMWPEKPYLRNEGPNREYWVTPSPEKRTRPPENY